MIIIKNDIGKRIINLREAKNWSQRELARRVDLNFSVMNRIESGERPVKDHELVDLSDALGVSTDYLLGKTSDSKSTSYNQREAILHKIAKEFPDIDLMFEDLQGMNAEQLKEVYNFIKYTLNKKG